MEYYTAVGVKGTGRNGEFCVEAAGRDYYLGETESYIWTAAVWAFAEKEEIYARMEWLLDKTFGKGEKRVDKETFSVYFQRLCTRGLMAAGCGESYAEAARDIFYRTEISVFQTVFAERLLAFLYGLKNGLGWKMSVGAFHRMKLAKREIQALQILGRTADITFLLSERKEMDEENRRVFMEALVSLYEKRQIAIRKIKEA